MTIDERLEFLLKSTESLHDTVQKNTDQIAEVGRKLDNLTGKLNQLAGSVLDLATIVSNHEKRLHGGGL